MWEKKLVQILENSMGADLVLLLETTIEVVMEMEFVIESDNLFLVFEWETLTRKMMRIVGILKRI